jgi:UDP-glucose 4-epimerase
MLNTNKLILITGGAGYIGSHVNKQLKEAGYKTLVIDDLSRTSMPQEDIIKADFADETVLTTIFSSHEVDAVMHFAAVIDVGESVADPAKYYNINLVKTLTLLNCMRQFKVNHFVFSSSAAVYGLGADLQGVVETDPCLPYSPYGHTKYFVEMVLKEYRRTYGLKSCSLRYFNAAGGDPSGKVKVLRKKESNLIPLILNSLLDEETGLATIYGTDYPTPDGTCIRDYIHVCDLAQAHILALEKLFLGEASECYNLGNDQGFSVREVIHSIQRVTKRELKIISGDRRPGDPPILLSNSAKARKELGWKQKFPGIDLMIEHAWNALNT